MIFTRCHDLRVSVSDVTIDRTSAKHDRLTSFVTFAVIAKKANPKLEYTISLKSTIYSMSSKSMVTKKLILPGFTGESGERGTPFSFLAMPTRS